MSDTDEPPTSVAMNVVSVLPKDAIPSGVDGLA